MENQSNGNDAIVRTVDDRNSLRYNFRETEALSESGINVVGMGRAQIVAGARALGSSGMYGLGRRSQ